ncbi:related to multidrug resistance proteins [Ceraceosorus bombacis]|uniref:Related to multidrug resistance proteins n=1 Tax=Ceraceosorus bombacis TaxID=401625 RepID=A0A0P1BF64_9BASI|nr:related to multidrug resistance proteins [Ceraceosorus bombacis]
MSAPSERTPLVNGAPAGAAHRPGSLGTFRTSQDSQASSSTAYTDEEILAQESAFSAIRDASHGVDPNSSAFIPPPPDQSHFSVQHSGLRLPDGPASEEVPGRRPDLYIILGAMWIGTFVAALDGTVVATIQSRVGSEFYVSKEVGWLGTSYLLTQTAFQPLYGRLSDIFGRKFATLFASAVFAVGTLFCGLAQTFPQLCAARAIAGVGGGGLTSMSTIVTSDLIDLKNRGTYQGIGNLVYAAGAALGGPIGGALADGGLGWRFAFLMQIPLCLIHLGVVSWKVDIPAGPGSMKDKFKRIDVWGALTLVSSITLILVGLSLGGAERDWSDRLVVGTLAAGAVVLTAFVLVEKYVAREPLMPMAVLFNRTPGAVALACWFLSMSQFGILFNVPQYFTSVEGTSSSYAGLHLIPNAIVASSCSLGSGLIMARTGNYRTMMLLGGISGVVGPLAMVFWQRNVTPEWAYWLTMPWGGAAFGSILTITLVALIASIDPAQMAAATGVTYLFRATGSVLGISLTNAILQNNLKVNLGKAHLPRKIIEEIRADVSYIQRLPPKQKALAVDAMQLSFRKVFIFIAVTGFLAFLSLLPIKQYTLPGSPAKNPPSGQAQRQQTIEEEDEDI